MVIRVTDTKALATVSTVKVRAGIVVLSPIYQTASVVPVADVAYISIGLGATTDTTGRLRFIADMAAVLDSTSLSLAKPAASQVALLDLESFDFGKSLASSISLQEEFLAVLIFLRDFVDQINPTDSQQKLLVKALAENLGATDTLAQSISKALFDGVAMNDLADLEDNVTFQAVKSVMNMVFMGDTTQFSHQKPLSDTQSVDDTPLLEPILAKTSDYSVQDAAVALFEKNLFEPQEITDALARAIEKLLIDSSSAIDFYQSQVDKPVSSSASANDLESFAFDSAKTETASATDSAVLNPQKSIAHSAVATDFSSLAPEKLFDHSAAASDYSSLSTVKGLTHAAVAIDSLASTLDRLIQSGVGINDSADLTDGLLFSTSKSFSNVAFASDFTANTYTLTRNSAAPVADSGSVVSQGYCDLTYFADDYVGATRAF